jgi:hypothetical protein
MVDVHRTCDRVIPLSEASENIKSDPIIDADNLEYLMHDIPQSLVPGYILKSLYVLTLLLSPDLELFPVLSSFPLTAKRMCMYIHQATFN